MMPFSNLINLLEQLTELRKPVYLLDYWFITKDIEGYKRKARSPEASQTPELCPRGVWVPYTLG